MVFLGPHRNSRIIFLFLQFVPSLVNKWLECFRAHRLVYELFNTGMDN